MTLKKIILLVAIAAFTAPQLTFSQSSFDTTKRILLASAVTHKAEKAMVVVRKANVVFPTIFEAHKDESQSFIESYSTRYRNHVTQMYTKSKTFFPKIKPILKKYGIPSEFAMLVAIESNFISTARSPVGAYGWWQFMDATAREFGLNIKENEDMDGISPTVVAKKTGTDDRTHLTKSTYAAAKYLRNAYRSLGDWLLVAASYNCGIGRVKSSMARTGKANPDFWDVKPFLPAETRNYVMKLISMNVLFKNYTAFRQNDMLFDDVVKEQIIMVPVPVSNDNVL